MPEMTRDFNSLFYIAPLLDPAVQAGGAGTEINGTAKKTHGCRSGAFLVEVGNIEVNGTIYLTFQHSADNTTWEDLTPIGLSSANITITDAAALGENNVIALAVDELYEGGYVRVQHYNTAADTLTAYGVQFIGFRALNRPIFKKWCIGETYLLAQIVQNDGYYFKNVLAFGQTLADGERALGTSVSEPGVGASTATYWTLYKGV
jgi:hypothetical protein